MTPAASLIRTIRLIHLYIGVFSAPAVLFFAITGALQTFSLHETTRGSSYQPPHLFVVLGQLHKKQTTLLPIRRPPPAAAKPERELPRTPAPVEQKAPETRPMKLYFLVVSLGLCASTATGIYMAYKFTRNKGAIFGTLAAGVAIPVLLLLFS